MSESDRPSLAPSEPRAFVRPPVDLYAPERTTRLQLTTALVLGLALAAIPLYLWRRPKTEPKAVELTAAALAAPLGSQANARPETEAPKALTMGEARTIGCHDKKKLPVENCERMVAVEQALAKAVDANQTCAREAFAGESVEFTADVSFKRNKLGVHVKKISEHGKLSKSERTCVAAIKHSLSATDLGPIPHQHTRYKLSMMATYPALDSRDKVR